MKTGLKEKNTNIVTIGEAMRSEEPAQNTMTTGDQRRIAMHHGDNPKICTLLVEAEEIVHPMVAQKLEGLISWKGQSSLAP